MNTTKKQKKTPVLKRLLPYAGKKGYMLPLAMLFSALSGIMIITPTVEFQMHVVNEVNASAGDAFFSPLGYYGTDAYGIYP